MSLDLERPRTRPAGWFTLLGVLLIPVIVAGGFLAATWQATDRLSRVQAAVVNLDDGTRINGQFVPLGRQLAAGLVTEQDENFTWVLADQENADAGLATGRFVAVVTIPKNFSENATSFSDADKARKAVIDVQTSRTTGVADSAIGQQIADVAANRAGRELTENYLDQIYLGFNESGKQFRRVADGASDLSDGAGELNTGVGRARDGIDELADGMGQLSTGGDQLVAGSDQLAAGTRQLAGGLDRAADGTAELPGQTGQLADGAGQLAGGLRQVAPGARQLADGSSQLADGLGRLAPGARQVADGAAPVADGLESSAAGARRLAEGTGPLADGLTRSADGSRQLANGTTELAGGLDRLTAATAELPAGADRLVAGAGELSESAPRLREGADALAPGARRVADGVAEYTSGADRLNREGIAPLTEAIGGIEAPDADRIAALRDGSGQVAEGAAGLDAGLTAYRQYLSRLAQDPPGSCPYADEEGGDRLCEAWAAGAASTAEAAEQRLTSGAQGRPALTAAAGELAEGASRLDTGVGATADQLDDFAGRLPELRSAAARVGESADALTAGSADLRSGASQLADGAERLGPGVQAFADGAVGFADGARATADGLRQLNPALAEAASGARELGTRGGQLADGLGALASGGRQLDTGAGQLADGLGRLAPGARQLAGGADQVAGGVEQSAAGAAQLAPGARQLADGMGPLTQGADQIAAGTRQLADGLAALPPQLRQAADGADQLADGAEQAAAGTRTYVDGVRRAADGSRQAADGMARLQDGSGQLAGGAKELSDGLADGVDELPNYSSQDRIALKTAAAQPVIVDGTDANLLPESTATSLLMVLALWLGGLATFLALAAVPARALTSRASSARLAVRMLAPGAAVIALQALALTIVGQVVLNLALPTLLGVFGFLLLAGASFLAVNQALVAWFGGAGRVISVIMVVLTAAGGILSAVPGWFAALLPLSPLTPALNGVRAVITGGPGVSDGVIGCLLWLVLALAAGVLAIARRRMADPRAYLRPRTA
ncbi:YhgE/Pip family protein [Naumannella huperziae]